MNITKSDHTMFSKHSDKGHVAVLIVYVDGHNINK